MQTMKCESCNRLVDDKPCPFCQSILVRPLKPGEVVDALVTPARPEQPRSEKIFVPSSVLNERLQTSLEASEEVIAAPAPAPTVPPTAPPTMPPPAPLTDERWHQPETTHQLESDAQRSAAPEAKEKKEIRGLAEFETLLEAEHFKAVTNPRPPGFGPTQK